MSRNSIGNWHEGAEPEKMDLEGFQDNDLDKNLDEDLDEDQLLEEEAWRRRRRNGCLIKITAILLILGMLGITIPQVLLQQFDRLKFPGLNQKLLADEIVQQSEPAVVSIQVTKEGGSSSGTGFNIAKNGKIITNYHVVENASLISVQFADGRTFHLTGSDYETVEGLDLALLRLPSQEELPYLKLTTSNRQSVQSGQEVTIIGNPQGYERVPQRGPVASNTWYSTNSSEDYLIDIPVNPGNSGSPVLDARGRVIAVVYATTEMTTQVKDDVRPMALAIPVQYIPQEWTR